MSELTGAQPVTVHTSDIRARVLGDQSRPHLVIGFTKRFRPFGLGRGLPDESDPWEHTAAWDEERQYFNEALFWRGVVETPQEVWLQRYPVIELLAVPCERPQDGIFWVRSVVGEGYDYSGAYSVPFRGDWQAHRRKYCSEKETLLLAEAGTHLIPDPQRGVHPHDLRRAIWLAFHI